MTKKATKEDWMPMCKTCKFFVIEPKEEIGECRRYPRQAVPLDDEFSFEFPLHHATEDWCGQYQRITN